MAKATEQSRQAIKFLCSHSYLQLIVSDACVHQTIFLKEYRLSTERDEVISGVIEDSSLSLEIQHSIGAGQLSSTSYREYLLKVLVITIIILMIV